MQPEFLNSSSIRRCGSLKFNFFERHTVYENDFWFSGVNPGHHSGELQGGRLESAIRIDFQNP